MSTQPDFGNNASEYVTRPCSLCLWISHSDVFRQGCLENVFLSSSTSNAGQEHSFDFQNSSWRSKLGQTSRSDPWYRLGDSSCCSWFSEHGSSFCYRLRSLFQRRIQLCTYFRLTFNPPKIWACLWNWIMGKGNKSPMPELQVKIVTKQEERKYGESICTHSIVTMGSTGGRGMSHSSPLFSASGPQGLERRPVTFFPAHLLDIFSSDLFPHREHCFGCSITDPPPVSFLFKWTVSYCRL